VGGFESSQQFGCRFCSSRNMEDLRKYYDRTRCARLGPTLGTLEYTMNSHVMRASYDVYVFHEAALRSKVGSFTDRTIELTVRVLQVGANVHHPSSGASPHGGIKRKLHTCEVVNVVEAS